MRFPLKREIIKKLTIEEYYIRLLVGYGENEKEYEKLVWQDEHNLDPEFRTHIYSDTLLEILNQHITTWYESLVNNIKSSEAYTVLTERTDQFFTKTRPFENLVELNSHIIEVYGRQKQQTQKLDTLKRRATALSESMDEVNIIMHTPRSLREVDKVMIELDATHKNLLAEREEVRRAKKKLRNRVKGLLGAVGIRDEENPEAVVQNRLRIVEQKVKKVKKIKKELEEEYEAIEEALRLAGREVLSPQIIGELTNIQQQLPLTNEAVLKQLGRPILSEIAESSGVAIPKGLYRFKLYIELWILYGMKGAVPNQLALKNICLKEGQEISPNESALIEKLSNCEI